MLAALLPDDDLEEYALEELAPEENIPLRTVLRIRIARRLDRWGFDLPKRIRDDDYDHIFRALVNNEYCAQAAEEDTIAAAIVVSVRPEEWPDEAGIEVAHARYEWLVRVCIHRLDSALIERVYDLEQKTQAAEAVLATHVSGPLVDALGERVAGVRLLLRLRHEKEKAFDQKFQRPDTLVRGDAALAVALAYIADEIEQIEYGVRCAHCEKRLSADLKRIKLYGEHASTEQALANDLNLAQQWKIETNVIQSARERLLQIRDRRLVAAANTQNPETLKAARRLLKDSEEEQSAERVYRACMIAELIQNKDWNGVEDQLRHLAKAPCDHDVLFSSAIHIVNALKLVASVRRAFFLQQSPSALATLIAHAYHTILALSLGTMSDLCGLILFVCDLASRRLLSHKGGTTTYDIFTWDLAAEALGGQPGSDQELYTLNDLKVDSHQLQALIDHFWTEGFQEALIDALRRARPLLAQYTLARFAKHHTPPSPLSTNKQKPWRPLSPASSPATYHTPIVTSSTKIRRKKPASSSTTARRRAWIPPGTHLARSTSDSDGKSERQSRVWK